MHERLTPRDCENCSEHKVLEERLKALDRIPGLLSWMNLTKGVMLLLVAFLLLMSSNIASTKTEMAEKQKVHEGLIKEQQEKISDQVARICLDVSTIEKNVAVMVNTFDMAQKEAAKERADQARRIERLEIRMGTK